MDGHSRVAIALLIGLAFLAVAAGGASLGGVSIGAVDTVSANESDVGVTDASLSDDEIEPGDSVEVIATVENEGNTTELYTAELEIDGDVVDTETVLVSPNESETVGFDPTFDDSGEYEIAVSGVDAGTLTVEEEDADEPEFVVSDAALSDDVVLVGEETVEVSATVTNEGNASGTYAPELEIDGDVESRTIVSLDPGESETVTFERLFGETGEYEIAVSGEDAGTLSVQEPGTAAVVSASIAAEWVQEGHNTTVTVDLEHSGDLPAETTLNVTADGDPIHEETVEVEPSGESITIEFEAVEGEIAVNGVEAGSVVVGDAGDGNPDDAGGDDEVDQIPGFTITLVALALVAIGVAVRVIDRDDEGGFR